MKVELIAKQTGCSGMRWGTPPTAAPAARAWLKTAGLILLLMAGSLSCRTAKRETPAPVALPGSFSQTGAAPLPGKWWLGFEDPALNDLIERALSGNFNLRIAWDRLAQAEAVARKAGAPLWPSVDAEARASGIRQRQTITGLAGESTDTTSRGTLMLGLGASYELDLWGRIRSTRDAAALDVEATREQLHAAAITLAAQVAATWYALVEQNSQIDLLERQLKTNEDVLSLVTLRFRRGSVGAADVLRQRQLVESGRGAIVTAESRAAVLEHQLAVLTGQPPQAARAPHRSELSPLPGLPETGVPAEVLQNRPDVRQAHLGVQAADRRLAAAIADRYPRVGIAADTSTTAENIRDLFNNWMASLAANLVAPIFDGGVRQAEVERNQALVSERLNAYGQTILVALGEVEDALVQEGKQREYLASLDRQLTLSQQTIERIRDSYTKGAVDYLRVLEALITQQSLQRTELQARRQLIDYRINLCRALGGGWEMTAPPSATLETAPTGP